MVAEGRSGLKPGRKVDHRAHEPREAQPPLLLTERCPAPGLRRGPGAICGTDGEAATYTTRQPFSPRAVQCALRQGWYHSRGTTHTVRCTKPETSLKGLGDFAEPTAAPAQGEATGSASLFPLPAPVTPPRSTCLLGEQGRQLSRQTLHPLLAGRRALKRNRL